MPPNGSKRVSISCYRLPPERYGSARRVNALEHVVIPRLVSSRNRIQRILEEREREEHFRLKRVQMRRNPHSRSHQ